MAMRQNSVTFDMLIILLVSLYKLPQRGRSAFMVVGMGNSKATCLLIPIGSIPLTVIPSLSQNVLITPVQIDMKPKQPPPFVEEAPSETPPLVFWYFAGKYCPCVRGARSPRGMGGHRLGQADGLLGVCDLWSTDMWGLCGRVFLEVVPSLGWL